MLKCLNITISFSDKGKFLFFYKVTNLLHRMSKIKKIETTFNLQFKTDLKKSHIPPLEKKKKKKNPGKLSFYIFCHGPEDSVG